MARALIVACGCRGRELARELADAGWQVRGTTRDEAGIPAIAAAGAEPVVADPDRVLTVLDHVADVAIVYWLLGSATGSPDGVAALHGPRLERLLEELVDTPVRGFVYEVAGTAPAECLEYGAAVVRAAADRHRIPVEIISADPTVPEHWVSAMTAAAAHLVAR